MELNRMLAEELKKTLAHVEVVKKKLESYPPGNLLVNDTSRTTQFYKIIDGKRIYLKKADHEELEKLVEKKYRQLQLKDDLQLIQAISAYLKVYQDPNGEGQYLEYSRTERFLQHAGIRRLLHRSSMDANAWQYADYPHLERYPEGLRFELPDGRLVRSKSEMIIGTELLRRGIPFRYEPEIRLGDRIVYPDFMIMSPKKNQFPLWEHLGMVDDQNYQSNAANKINDYIMYGYYPGQNLILTAETRKDPFDYVKTNQIIDAYFL